jgi:hypothetical protein
MTLQRRDFLLVVTLAAAVATPAFGQAVAPTVAPANSGKEKSAASIRDFSGVWVHGSIPGFEPLPTGPTSLVNRSRRSTAQLIRDLVVDWQGRLLFLRAVQSISCSSRTRSPSFITTTIKSVTCV